MQRAGAAVAKRLASSVSSAAARVTPVDPPVQRLALSRGDIGYTDEPGSSAGCPVIVALHGGPGSVHDFRYIGGALGSRARLVRLDLPGHGSSAEHVAESPSTKHAAEAAKEACDLLGLGDSKVVVMGHSLGAQIALELAVQLGPARVAGMCMLAPVSLRPHQALRPYWLVQALSSALTLPLVGDALFKPLIWLLYTQLLGFDPKRTSAAESAFTMRQVGLLDFERAASNARAIKAYGVPAMVCWATDDPILEPAIAKELGAALPAGPRLEFSSGGHFMNKHHAAEVVDALLDMLGAAAGSAAPARSRL
ncbi:hypothetical protein FNF29_04332 [Cafeteria roenbergensis]|uniref:AB hydrolase-1 domain-containing protein n=1 Tax=Cafeteria roenbergensis TaxID=33653 RepID=A0A5A8DJ77_CAFRO|nr:hypothetical protein FNF29_04332 [Cafeteria roenbergensis]KAA0164694.1 hypothetical protein FNF31_02232 [Cafeteria roenbergensis]KAA0169160.1 hypothetical protein FNF28_02286 [Cafeteria roenbergensis]|eukprot:KAA0151926.1 hypothetical protein FNF29_04332 [Cafeteria roenbergensis]